MDKQARTDALRALLEASQGRRFESGLPGDTARWADPAWRRSPEAAIAFDAQTSVRLSPEAVTKLEEGVAALRQLDGPRKRWDPADLWGMVASLVATLPTNLSGGRLQVELSRRLGMLEDPGPGFVGFVLQGAAWRQAPRTLHGMVIGRAGKDFRTELDLRAAGRPTPLPDRRTGWLDRVFPEGRSDAQAPVVVATWVESSHSRAVADARRRFLDLVDACLLFRHEIDPALAARLRAGGIERMDRNPAAPTCARDRFGDAALPEWTEPEPLELDALLELGVSQGLVEPVLAGTSPLCWRGRMAARMHSRALASGDPAEAVLLLWSAFDALLGDGSSSPDKSIANRFAVLHSGRQAVEQGYIWLVGHLREVRLAASQGRYTSRLDDLAFVEEAAHQLRRAACRLWSILVERGGARQDDYGTLFQDLKDAITAR